MARIIYSEMLTEQVKLFKAVKTKHDALGAGSPLTAFLASKGIVLADDDADADDALLFHSEGTALQRESENSYQLRNIHWKPVMTAQRKLNQFIKTYYKPNYEQVGLWGSAITATGKISYPSNFLLRTQAMETLLAKHASFAPNPSPLDPYIANHALNMATFATETTTAKGHHNTGTTKADLAENKFEQMRNAWNPVMEHVRSIGQFLIKFYDTNPKAMGDWGFTIDDSPRAPKFQNSTVLPAGQLKINGVTIGGTLTNTGTVPLHVFKKFGVSEPFDVVQPGGQLGMIKGYSNIVVVNPSTLVKGKLKVLCHQ